MAELFIILVSILNGLIWVILRRIYGGGCKKGFLSERGVQTVIMMLAMLPFTFYKFNPLLCVLLSITLTCWLQFIYWSKGHGPAFDMATDKIPSQETKSRYEDMWGYKYVCKRIPYPRWYGFLFDYKLLNIRYFLPMIPVGVIFSTIFLLIGLSTSPVYAFCWALYREEKWFFDKLPKWCNYPTDLAEVVSGFIFGFGLSYACFKHHGGIPEWFEYIQTLLSMI